MLKNFIYVLIVFSVLLVSCERREAPITQDVSTVSSSVEETQPVQSEPEPEPTPPSPPEPKKATVITAGDNLIHAALYMDAQRKSSDGGYDFSSMYAEITPLIQSYDLAFINQESLVVETLTPSHYPMFASPPQVATAAYDAGFRFFNLSNNHSYDKGAVGVEDTLNFWQTKMPDDVAITGFYNEQQTGYTPYTVNDIEFGFLGYTQHTNGLPTPSSAVASVIYTDELERMEQQIAQARAEVDVLAVSLHWGNENSHNVADYQRQLAQWLCDRGVDVIIGHHPHVLQPIEWYESADGHQMLCIYSLANFLSGQDEPPNTTGSVVSFTVTQEEGENIMISEVIAHPTIVHSESGFTNYAVYKLQDYTEELMSLNNIARSYGSFTIDWAWESYINNTPEEFRVEIPM